MKIVGLWLGFVFGLLSGIGIAHADQDEGFPRVDFWTPNKAPRPRAKVLFTTSRKTPKS